MKAPRIHVAPPARGWRNTQVWREPDLPRTRRIWTVLLGVVTALVPLALSLVQQMEHVQLRYRIEEARAEHDRLLEMERRLRARVATLEAPERVEVRAVDELGLVLPASTRRVVVSMPAPGRGSLMARAPDGIVRAR